MKFPLILYDIIPCVMIPFRKSWTQQMKKLDPNKGKVGPNKWKSWTQQMEKLDPTNGKVGPNKWKSWTQQMEQLDPTNGTVGPNKWKSWTPTNVHSLLVTSSHRHHNLLPDTFLPQWPLMFIDMCQGLNSHNFHIIGDKLINPISLGFIGPHYKDSLLKVG